VPARQRTVFAAAGLSAVALSLVGLLMAWPGGINTGRLSPAVLAEEAAVQQLFDERIAPLRSGVCHFNERGPQKTFDGFLTAWHCWGSPITQLLVVGDSHAADVALALRSAGLDVGQMTGAGCSLAPALMTRNCRRQFDLVKQDAQAHGLQGLVLVNRFTRPELNEQALAEMAAYWHLPGVRIWFFTQRPEFPNLALVRPRALMRGAPLAADSLRPTLDLSLESEAFGSELARRLPDTQVVNSRLAFCVMTTRAGCPWQVDGKALVVDGHHLSLRGAAMFGQQVLDTAAPELSRGRTTLRSGAPTPS